MTVTTRYMYAVCPAILSNASPTDTFTVVTATTYIGPEITFIFMPCEVHRGRDVADVGSHPIMSLSNDYTLACQGEEQSQAHRCVLQ